MEWVKQLWERKRPNWSRTFWEYLFSYIVIVFLAITVVAAVVFGSLLPRLEREVKAGNMSLLMQVREAMDMRAREMNRIAHRISIHPDLTPYMIGNDGYSLYRTQRQLEEYRSSNSFVYDLAVYYHSRDDDMIYAASGAYELDSFFAHVYRFEEWRADSFRETTSRLLMPVMRPLEPVQLDKLSSRPFATYLHPLPVNANKPYGVVMFLIDGQEFAAMFQNILHADAGYSFIINDQGELVAYASSGPEADEPDVALRQFQVMSLPDGTHTVTAGNAKWSVMKLSSDVNRWTYVSAMPNNLTMKQVYAYKKQFLYTILLVLVAGLAVSLLLTLRHYRPLKGLAETVRNQKWADCNTEVRDEISIISHAVGMAAKENEDLHSIIKSQAVALKEQVLLPLLKGKIRKKAELDEGLKLADLSLDYPRFAVLLFWIDEYHHFVRSKTPAMQQLLKDSLINVVEELSLELGKGYGLKWADDRGVALIVNMHEHAGRRELEALARKAADFFQRHFTYSVTVGIGRTYTDSFMVYRSYLEALRAAEYRFIKGHGQVLFYELVADRQGRQFWYPIDLQRKLVMAIKQGNIDEVQQTIREITSRIGDQTLTVETVEYICFDMINTIMKTMIEMGIELHDYFDESMESLFSPKYETMEELEQLVVHFCSRVCRYIESQKESKNTHLYQKVQAYINEHYTDPTISLEKIAARFDVSPSYLSRYFKNQTGSTLMRYIDEMRMNKAKELFVHTDLKLKDIIESVGYVDQTNFNRKFKRAEGVTPTEYRNIARSGLRKTEA